MLLIHFATSRISTVKQAKHIRFQGAVENGDNEAAKVPTEKKDFVANAAGVLSEKSNKVIDKFYQHIENGDFSKKPNIKENVYYSDEF